MNTFLIIATVLFDAAELLGLLIVMLVLLLTHRRGETVIRWGKLVNIHSVSILLTLVTLNLAVWTR